MRSRTELMFQVASRRVIAGYHRCGGPTRPGTRQNNGARSGGKTGRLHVRSVWGKSVP